MKNMLKKLPMKLFTGVAVLAILAGVASSALAGFGPERETRVWNGQENGFDHVTFNSYTGVPNGIGDERDFMRGVQVGRDSVWSDPVSNVDSGAEVEVKMYIHNNANPELNDAAGNPGVAKNVTVKASVPNADSQTQQINGSISADNATPGTVTDTLDVSALGGKFFKIAYVPGSAQLHANGATTALSDSLVTTGVNIGDQKGCFEFIREVTFRVKVTVASYQMQKSARLNGEASDKWRKVVNAKVGDKVDYRIWFQNGGTATLQNVTLVDNLPSYVTVVPGSMKLYKGANVATVPETAIQANGKQININTGEYKPADDSYFVFTVTINDVKELACGAHQINNNAYYTPEGYGTLNDYASVNVISKDCETNTPSYACNAITATLSGKTVTVKVDTSATGGATVKQYTYDFGDKTTALVTDKNPAQHTYAADGTYKISVSVLFSVNGSDKSASSQGCTATVTVGSTTPPTTPPTLPNTGAGNTIGLFAAVSAAGAVAHQIFVRRRAMR